MGWIRSALFMLSTLALIGTSYGKSIDSVKFDYSILSFGNFGFSLKKGINPIPYNYNFSLQFRPDLITINSLRFGMHVGLFRNVDQNLASVTQSFIYTNRYQYGLKLDYTPNFSSCSTFGLDVYHFSEIQARRSINKNTTNWQHNFGWNFNYLFDFNVRKRSLGVGLQLSYIKYSIIREGATDPIHSRLSDLHVLLIYK